MAVRSGSSLWLPHGIVSVANIADVATREALRKLSENQQALARAVAELERKEKNQ